MSAAGTGRPHRHKARIPPGQQALAAADALRHHPTGADAAAGAGVVIDMAAYERAAHGRNTLT